MNCPGLLLLMPIVLADRLKVAQNRAIEWRNVARTAEEVHGAVQFTITFGTCGDHRGTIVAVFQHDTNSALVEELCVTRHVLEAAARVKLDTLEAIVERCLDISPETLVATAGQVLTCAVVSIPPRD